MFIHYILLIFIHIKRVLFTSILLLFYPHPLTHTNTHRGLLFILNRILPSHTQVFHEVAYRARNRGDLLAGIDEFLDKVTVLPPGEWDPQIRLEPPSKIPSQDVRKQSNDPRKKSVTSTKGEEDRKPPVRWRKRYIYCAVSGLEKWRRMVLSLMNCLKCPLKYSFCSLMKYLMTA